MNRKKAIIISLILIALVASAVPVGIYLVRQQQTVKTGAQTSSCQPPGSVTNVQVEYPFCQQGSTIECSFTQASCSWDAVTGAVSYNLKVTEEDTNTVIKTDSVSSSTTKISFPVVSGRTYKCEVTAVNSCGSTGGTGSDSLLCKVDEVLASTPTPTPTTTSNPTPTGTPNPTPTATPNPTPTPTPAPTTRPQYECAQSCSTSQDCKSGLVCTKTSNGFSYCSMPEFQQACSQNPAINTCCQAPAKPAPQPVLQKAGLTDDTNLLIGGGIFLVILGAAFLML